jgi:hypothetical protein
VAEPTPLEDLVVNDRYWLGRGREMVTASIRGRDEAAGRLSTAVGWFWTVYTTAALVGVAFTNRRLPAAVALLLALPAVLLVAAYALVMWAQTPIGTSFDPRVPEQIALAHQAASRAKQRRLIAATACTLAAALAVGGAVTATALTGPAPVAGLYATHSIQGGRDLIAIRAQLAATEPVTLTLTPQGAQPLTLLETSDRDGVLHASVPVPAARSYQVSATWTDNNTRWQLARTVMATP